MTEAAHRHTFVKAIRLHRPEREEYVLGAGPDPKLLEVIEGLACSDCEEFVPRPDDMPDYGQVDRLWRRR